MIKRDFWNCPKNVKATAYTAIVCTRIDLPTIQTAQATWEPYLQEDIALLDRPRKAARFCSNICIIVQPRFCSNIYHPTASVTRMLQNLGWTSLELRWTKPRLDLLNNMSSDQIDIDVNCYLQPHSEVRTQVSHRYRQGKLTKNIYFYSFFPKDHKTME